MAKSSTVNVPIVGKTPKGAVVAGLVTVVAVGGYLLYKHMTKPATTATGTNAYGYGASAYGYGSGYAYGYGGYGPYGGGGYPFGPYSYGYGGNPPPQGPPTTNAQWGTQAEAALGSNGHDAIAAALGKYLTAGTLTEQQYTIVQQAIAVEGYPPVPGTGNYPPQAHVSKGKPGGGNIPVPNVVGQETDAGMRALSAVGLVGSHPPLKPGVGSTITAESPAAGTKVKSGSTVKLSIKEK